jgi:exopolysaccharide biosynthesis polyprenyl glycosylphosphotransferase
VVVQRTDERRGLQVIEVLDSSPGAKASTVMVTGAAAADPRLASYRRMKRFAFVAASSLACGFVAFLAVGLAHFLVDGSSHGFSVDYLFLGGQPESTGYLLLGGMAGAIVMGMTARSRPDLARRSSGYLEEILEACNEALFVAVVLAIVAFFWRPSLLARVPFSRGTVLLALPLLAVSVGLTRCLMRAVLLKLRKHGHNQATVVVIGDGPSASSFLKSMRRPTSGFRLIAHITRFDSSTDLGRLIERVSYGESIDEVVIASFAMPPEQVESIVSHPSLRSARLRAVPEMFGLPPSKVVVEPFGDFPMLTLFENPVRGPHWVVKRAVDLVGASILLLLLGLPMLVIALVVRLTSPGPVLFRQERVGMDGKTFQLLKFRSMTNGASDEIHREYMSALMSTATATDPSEEPGAAFFKLTNDPRITTAGRVLRRYSLDELPQLLNVVKGDMSLVGPRPALAYEVDLYEDWQRRRLDVLPGMTGLWQVSGRSRLSPADMLRLDVHYAETWSLFKDFLIILKTVPAILRDNAR